MKARWGCIAIIAASVAIDVAAFLAIRRAVAYVVGFLFMAL